MTTSTYTKRTAGETLRGQMTDGLSAVSGLKR